jgi:hypothetical protein
MRCRASGVVCLVRCRLCSRSSRHERERRTRHSGSGRVVIFSRGSRRQRFREAALSLTITEFKFASSSGYSRKFSARTASADDIRRKCKGKM